MVVVGVYPEYTIRTIYRQMFWKTSRNCMQKSGICALKNVK